MPMNSTLHCWLTLIAIAAPGSVFASDARLHDGLPRPGQRTIPIHSQDPRLRESLKSLIREFPDADPIVVGRNGTPMMLRGNFGKIASSGKESRSDNLEPKLARVAALMGLKRNQLSLISEIEDPKGGRHFWYAISIDGIPVVGGSVGVHINSDGVVEYLSGRVPDEIGEIKAPPAVELGTARARVHTAYADKKPKTKNERLVYLLQEMDTPMQFAWELPVEFEDDPHKTVAKAYVNAETGAIISLAEEVFEWAERYVWDNYALGPNFDWRPVPAYGIIPVWADQTINEYGSYGPGYAAQVAFNNLGYSRNYFFNRFAYSSYWGNQGPLQAIVNSIFIEPNGALTGYGAVFTVSAPDPLIQQNGMIFLGTGIYGMIPDISGNFAGAIDVVGHEFTHGLSYFREWGSIRNSASLWGGESAALEEAFADIFGAMIENSVLGYAPDRWRMGEATGVVERSLQNPAQYGGYDYYTQYSTVMGPYINSTIASLAYRLCVTGGTNPNSSRPPVVVPPLGISVSEQVFFYALRYILPSGSNFIMARAATEYSADNIFGSEVRQAVGLAWTAVGVPGSSSGGGNFRAMNVSTRGYVGTGDDVMIAGFVLGGGSQAKPMLVRGVGPKLASFGISGVLADPIISLSNGISNDNWGTAPNLNDLIAKTTQVGAFQFDSGSLDAAALASFPGGIYTMIVNGISSGTGVGMAEVYDTDSSNPLRLMNLSTRVKVRSSDPAIAGFVIEGNTAKKILIRAVGPELGRFGLTGYLADPKLTLFAGSTAVYSNDNWGQAYNAQEIASTGAAVGAFGLSSGSADSAILITIPPGAYTAHVTGGDGISLVEIYDVN